MTGSECQMLETTGCTDAQPKASGWYEDREHLYILVSPLWTCRGYIFQYFLPLEAGSWPRRVQ
jgi:hypothetical protein